MKRRRIIGLGIFALLIHMAPSSAQQASKASIEGTVMRLGTSDAISGVRVTLFSESLLRPLGTQLPGVSLTAIVPPDLLIGAPPLPSTLTDEYGQFQLRDVNPGTYRLVFTRNGYVRQELGPSIVPGQGIPIVVAPGQEFRGVVEHLTPTGSVSGTIRDPQGKLLTGIQVQLIHQSYDSFGLKSTQIAFSARTDDRGEYHLSYVSPGSYFLTAGRSMPFNRASGGGVGGAESFGASPNEVAEQFATVYYPGTLDSTKAKYLDVAPGAELAGVSLSMDPEHLFSIRGRVVDSATGKPPAVASFLLTVKLPSGSFQPYGSFARNAYDASTGSFEIRNLSPGLYGIVISTPQGVNANAFAPVRVADSDVENTLVTLAPLVSMSGQIRVEGQSLSRVPETGGRLRFHLQTMWEGAPVTITNVPTLTLQADSDGTLISNGVRPIEYRLTVNGLPPGYYIKQARLGELDLLRQSVRNITSDTDGLDVLLASDSGSVEGNLASEQTSYAAGGQIVLIPDEGNTRIDLFRSAIADDRGHFKIEGVPPGNYRVYAWEAIEPYAWFDPNIQSRFESQAIPIHVAPSSTQNLSLKAAPPVAP